MTSELAPARLFPLVEFHSHAAEVYGEQLRHPVMLVTKTSGTPSHLRVRTRRSEGLNSGLSKTSKPASCSFGIGQAWSRGGGLTFLCRFGFRLQMERLVWWIRDEKLSSIPEWASSTTMIPLMIRYCREIRALDLFIRHALCAVPLVG
jgi:hypothetical protein